MLKQKLFKVIAGLLFTVLCIGFCNGLFGGSTVASNSTDTGFENSAANNFVNISPQAEAVSLAKEVENPAPLITKSYKLEDNSGYNADNNKIGSPFEKTYAAIYLSVAGGSISNDRLPDNTDAYGYRMGDKIDEENFSPVTIGLKYNYPDTENINKKNWSISKDTWAKPVNKIEGVGIVGTGAVLVQKSYNGSKYEWENPYSNTVTTSYHTIDFTTHYSPKERTDIITIYTPSGADLAKGIYIKVLFAYELKGNGYINVLEETTFYICNAGAEVLFQNLIFTDANEMIQNASKSLEARLGGTILDGHATNEGFKINANGNTSYEILYSKNGTGYIRTYDGAVFTDPGKYVFKVIPKIGDIQFTTIYINDRGIEKNIETYFGKGLITEDSHRIFIDDSIPVFTAGKTGYAVKKVEKNHIPLVGRIGYYLETLSIKDFNKKYKDILDTVFTIDTRIAVDSGYTRLYDNNGDSVDGYAKDFNIDGKTIESISGFDVYKTVAKLSKEENLAGTWQGKLTEPGLYAGEFANNPNYFEGIKSGDCYHFIFKFRLIEGTSTPIINQNLLENNLSVSDYAAGYYGVNLPTKGVGTVTFAFTSYAESYSFAYEYYRSLVLLNEDGSFEFNEKNYQTQFEVLGAVAKASDEKVERRYFDASNPSSYLTVQNAAVDILSKNLSYDIVVMSSLLSTYDAVLGEPYLNDKLYYYLDEYDNLKLGKMPVIFIKVAGFESDHVQLICEDSPDIKYDIKYNESVEEFLSDRGAPSGRYKIIETNIYGNKNIYYAIYIKPGDVQTIIRADSRLNEVETSHILGRHNSTAHFTANYFIIRSALNSLDPYGIIKIEKLGENGYINTYQLSEVKDLVIDEEGNYAIHIVDRLGNMAKIYVHIYVAEKVYTLTLNNLGREFSKEIALGGKTYQLPKPTNPDSAFEFIGWKDEDGAIYKDAYKFNASRNVVLEAVWNYKQTIIEVFDGDKIKTYDTIKPGDKAVLPEISKDGLTLHGFLYEKPDGTISFYRGQITSVPNVSYMKLSAMWVDYNQTFTDIEPAREGMVFVGWLNPTDTLFGMIYNSEDVEPWMTVYSLWLTEPSEEANSPAVLGMFKNIGSALGTLSVILILGAIFMLVFMYALRKRKAQSVVLSSAKDLNIVNKFGLDFSLPFKMTKELKHIALSKTKDPLNNRQKTKYGKIKAHAKGGGVACEAVKKKPAILIVSVILALIFAFSAVFQLSSVLKQNSDKNAALAKAKQEYLDQQAQTEALTTKNKPSNEYLKFVEQSFNAPATSEEDGEPEISDEEAFLYSIVFIDLLTMGYDVFPARAVILDTNGETTRTVRGLAYSMYDEAYTKEDEENEKVYFGAGFVSLFKEETISDSDVKSGVEIIPILEEGETQPEEYGFILSFEETYGYIHYIAFEKYVKYSVSGFKIDYAAVENNPADYDLTLGYLYDYDLGRPVYDPDLGKAFNPEAFSITQGIDYDYAYQTALTMIEQQDKNYVTVDTVQVLYISYNAINNYITHHQDESYLGVSTDQLQQVEAQLNNTVFYYIDGEGNPQLAPMPPEPNIFRIILSVFQIALGGLLCITCAGAAAGAWMIAGGVVGIIAETLCAEIQTLFNGASTVANGLKCLMMGISLLSCGPLGVFAGIVMIGVGGVTAAFGVNDILLAMTGRNFIRELTGMSEQAYMWANLGLNIASTVLTIAGSAYKARWNAQLEADRVEAAQNALKSQAEFRKDALAKAGLSKAEGTGLEAHHLYPKQFGEEFIEIGVDFNNGSKNGMMLDEALHQALHQQGYNQLWSEFFNGTTDFAVTQKGAAKYLEYLMKLFGL